MATVNQINFLKQNKISIKEPILIVGSKQYEFDEDNIRSRLTEWGYNDITGIDIFSGEGVDLIIDITDPDTEFLKQHRNHFLTLICMEVLTHVQDPFSAAKNITSVLKPEGTAILSECYTRKISKIPIDFWRFTYDGTKKLFSDLDFDDSKTVFALIRDKSDKLLPLKYPLPQLLSEKNADEGSIGYFLRRVHRKFFATGIFRLSRLLPETSIFSIAKKQPLKMIEISVH